MVARSDAPTPATIPWAKRLGLATLERVAESEDAVTVTGLGTTTSDMPISQIPTREGLGDADCVQPAMRA